MDSARDIDMTGGGSQDESAFEDDEAFDFELDMNRSDTKVWLVKIPNFLADHWSAITEEGRDIGRIRINHSQVYNWAGPHDVDGITMLLNDTPDAQHLPTEYRVMVRDKDVKNTYVFEEGEDGEAKRIMGTVHHDCIVSVKNVLDPRYIKINEKRHVEQLLPAKRTQAMDDDARPIFIAPTQHATNDQAFLQRKKPRKSNQLKATRMPREDLINLLFSAFEKYQYWNLKGIIKYTNQPQVYIKEVLAEVCDLVKKGKYHSMYRLKDEYCRHTSSMDGTMNPEAQAGDNEVDEESSNARAGPSTAGAPTAPTEDEESDGIGDEEDEVDDNGDDEDDEDEDEDDFEEVMD